MSKFKIENFCQEHNEEFKKYYNFLNSSIGYQITLQYLNYLHNDKLKEHILNLIKKNHKYIIDRLNKIDIIISFYKQNKLINKSEIGKFFSFYEIHKNKTDIKNDKQLFELFYKLISYNGCLDVLKECFYIFSDYRSCIYFMTPSVNFNKVTSKNKILIKNVIHNFRDNLNTMNQVISHVYSGTKTPWGSHLYTMGYSMFETLMIIKQYFKNPLKEINIEFSIKKECNKKDIIKKLCYNYHMKKFKNSNIDDKINEKHVNNVSQFILILKRLGYDLWFVVYLVFDTIYPIYKFKGITLPIIYTHEKIQLQMKNNELGVMCFILTENGFITNSNIFNNFND
jgi:hypothetical protein